MVSVMNTTTMREILQQCEEGAVQDLQGTLLRGVVQLKPDMTVSEAELEEGDEISLVWSDPFVEIESWTGEKMDQDLYVRIPPHITRIKDRAFDGCKSLVKVVIHDSVTSIGANAFSNCSSLKEVKIPNSVPYIAVETFSGCSSLAEVLIPDSVTSIGDRAFRGCSSLREIHIPDSVTSVASRAFARCSSLTEVKLPKSVTLLCLRLLFCFLLY